MTKEEAQKQIRAIKECQSDPESYTPPELMQKISRGEWIEDDRIKKGLLCFSKKLNYINSNGLLNADYVISDYERLYGTHKLKELRGCVQQQSTPEETAYQLFKCKSAIVGIAVNILEAN